MDKIIHSLYNWVQFCDWTAVMGVCTWLCVLYMYHVSPFVQTSPIGHAPSTVVDDNTSRRWLTLRKGEGVRRGVGGWNNYILARQVLMRQTNQIQESINYCELKVNIRQFIVIPLFCNWCTALLLVKVKL